MTGRREDLTQVLQEQSKDLIWRLGPTQGSLWKSNGSLMAAAVHYGVLLVDGWREDQTLDLSYRLKKEGVMSRSPLTEEQKARKREREKLWRQANKDKVREKNQRFLKNNPTVFSDYYAANRERRLAQAAEYAKNNVEKIREKARHFYYVRKQQGKQVRSLCVEGMRRRRANRRALLADGGGKLLAGHVSFLLQAQQGRCANCRCQVGGNYHVDHIQPLAKGGRNEAGNLQILCPTCNLKKHAKDPIAWANENGRLL